MTKQKQYYLQNLYNTSLHLIIYNYIFLMYNISNCKQCKSCNKLFKVNYDTHLGGLSTPPIRNLRTCDQYTLLYVNSKKPICIHCNSNVSISKENQSNTRSAKNQTKVLQNLSMLQFLFKPINTVTHVYFMII